MTDFVKIGITSPLFIGDEPRRIVELLNSGIDIMHIRKPDSTSDRVAKLIMSIPTEYRHRLCVHYYPQVCAVTGVERFHLNSLFPEPPEGITTISRSCHSVEELKTPVPCGCTMVYQTLSPIFDSISKPGYCSKFNLDELRREIDGLNVVALGGVTPDKMPRLQSAGFVGAAMLGCLWT